MKSADYSHYNGGWLTTSAYDLAGIAYDAAGNITALQRFRQNATLIDNLTYSYPGSSNRLSSVADAINTTSETWDAEDGAFTYDANGNMKTAPAPYSVTAVTYDHQNLPVSLTRSGTTTTYRYNEAGQRITKQVGSGSTEVYLLQGALTLAVYTVPASGTPSSWYFNVLAGEKVVGRQPNTGSRSYYHTDLLGSTRSVVQGTTVVESYDYEPWGLLMPGRTLGSGTKEGFTSKERDAETGFDYFGARHYMAALGRWTAVDPLADSYASHSPYHYSGNSPIGYRDVDGRYYVGTDGQPVVVSVVNGAIRVGSNASAELRRMAGLINRSGSPTASAKFLAVGTNETRVHFRVSQEVRAASGGGFLLGLHQAHDAAGTPLEWNAETGTFEGQPAFGVDSEGRLIYEEATITLFETTIAALVGGDVDSEIVAVNAHENEHNLNTEDIQAIRDRGEGKINDRNVEVAASNVEQQVRREIRERN